MIRLEFPDGVELDVDGDDVWDLTTLLVAAETEIAHAVEAAADLRLALKVAGNDGSITLNEQQASAVRAILSTLRSEQSVSEQSV